MKTLVLSGINFFEGGPLSIYYDCLDAMISSKIDSKYRIIAFVHKKQLFEKYKEAITLIELPDSRKNYINRLYYEFEYFYKFSLKHDIDIWISLHDITPRVKAKKIYTYCHNPSPFMKKDLSKIKYSWRNVAFSYFYKYLYRINIKSATAIIVQQDWMREEFLRMFPVRNVIVARPKCDIHFKSIDNTIKSDKKVFAFASFPRYFKNFEIICEACERIENNDSYEVWLTIDGSENNYAKTIKKHYSHNKSIKWLGLQSRDELFNIYNTIDCFIFPSYLETWGLPISEFKVTTKPMILADLPYAHETLGDYEKALFFNPSSADELASIMQSVISDSAVFLPHKEKKVNPPFAKDWNELISIILS